MNKKLYMNFLILLACLFIVDVQAQELQLRGTVRDMSDQQTLPGVNVTVKGTTTGTVTDINGQYTITADTGSVLVFTFVGMQRKEVEVDGSTRVLNVDLLPEVALLQEFVVAISAIARDRETPVAISTISAEVISERLGSQEFPEILKSTPSVYATKDGGGFGDGRINMRGFDSNNIGVLINGVPVNDMENGRVYWSNWAGLSDVTQTMQVQRGLGASRLAISSVGGTINIVTQTTDARKGGTVFYGFGHDGYERRSVSLSTGLMDNGWTVTALGGRTTGQGFVDGTEFDGWSYFFNASKQLSDRHIVSFTAFGAPQWHNQRWPRQLIQTFREHERGIRYNPSQGLLNGQSFNSAHNEYHKPQISMNHFWSVSPNTTLSTAAYASISSGGGRRMVGPNNNWYQFDRNTGLPTGDTKLTPYGLLDFDYAVEQNSLSPNGSRVIVANATNEHDWYGILSSLQTEQGNFRYTGGLDLRYYRGYHYQEITDLLGGTHYQDVMTRENQIHNIDRSVVSRNVNRETSARLTIGDKIAYHDLGEVAWGGLFAQAEYVSDQYSAFISGTLSNTSYRRTDYFLYYDEDSPERPKLLAEADEFFNQAAAAEQQGDSVAYVSYMNNYNSIMNMQALQPQQSDWIDFLAWSIKGGANYNISARHNVFANAGYFTRAPFFRFAFVGFTNVTNPGVNHERVISSEIGYGYRSPLLAANVILYRTEWLDKALVRNLGQGVIANITGLDALHQGLEIDFTIRPERRLEIRGMFSYGDWKWQDDLIAEVFDEDQVFLDSIQVYAKGLMVGNSAQITAALGLSYELLPNVRLGVDANHYDRLFADFNVEDRGDINLRGQDSWQMPAYQMVDLSLRYRFKIAGLDATLQANINNLFNTEAIRDATDGVYIDPKTNERILGRPDVATVYYGWGRTWTTSFRVRF
ncbi:MAG: TonB-dependent receptor [Bacteroidetes bacterium]|nr:MAG: TonB-dependent receptor [Bacteroidota bacterium]